MALLGLLKWWGNFPKKGFYFFFDSQGAPKGLPKGPNESQRYPKGALKGFSRAPKGPQRAPKIMKFQKCPPAP